MPRPKTGPLYVFLSKSYADSEAIASCSIVAEVLYIRITLNADRHGRCYGSPRRLMVNLLLDRWARDEITLPHVESALAELESVGLLIIGDGYVEITDAHQIRLLRRPRSKIPRGVRNQVLERDGHRCLSCGSKDSLEIDHIHPFALGGGDDLDNLQTLCKPCNIRKADRL